MTNCGLVPTDSTRHLQHNLNTLNSVLTIKLASSIFFSTSRIVLFLNSETENLLYGVDLKCSNHAIEASTNLFGTYLPITLEFCELFSRLYLHAEPSVHPRGLQIFQKTLWRPNEWQKLYFLTQTPTRRDRYLRKNSGNREKYPPAVSESQRKCSRKDARTYPETCMPTAIDWSSIVLM